MCLPPAVAIATKQVEELMRDNFLFWGGIVDTQGGCTKIKVQGKTISVGALHAVPLLILSVVHGASSNSFKLHTSRSSCRPKP